MEQWVCCLNCGRRYYLEDWGQDNRCPSCRSREYEGDSHIPEYDLNIKGGNWE